MDKGASQLIALSDKVCSVKEFNLQINSSLPSPSMSPSIVDIVQYHENCREMKLSIAAVLQLPPAGDGARLDKKVQKCHSYFSHLQTRENLFEILFGHLFQFKKKLEYTQLCSKVFHHCQTTPLVLFFYIETQRLLESPTFQNSSLFIEKDKQLLLLECSNLVSVPTNETWKLLP